MELCSGLAMPEANDNVPDASATAIAQGLVTLCNRIFGEHWGLARAP